jgi:Tol biopolymer transport system component
MVNNYVDASVTSDSKKLVAVLWDWHSQIWTMPAGEAGSLQQMTFGNEREVAWTPDDRIVYTSYVSDGTQLWIMDKNGKNQKQLTSSPARFEHPSISRDGRSIAYVSDAQGKPNIWRMDIDGGNQKQLTNGDADDWPTFSADSRWVIYNSTSWSLWKVPVEGGEASKITENSPLPRVSPDGKLIASLYTETQGLKIASQESGESVKMFEILWSGPFLVPCHWLSNGRAVSYVDTRGAVSNLRVQPLDGSHPKQITDFKSDHIFSFDWSPDGKQLAIARGTEIGEAVLISNFR